MSIISVVVETIPEDHMALTNAKSALSSAAASVTMRSICNRTFIANNGGATFLEKMLSDVKALREQVQGLDKSLKQTRKLAMSYEDVRMRCFLTYLRDHDGQKEMYKTKIKHLNQGVVHGGHCIADSEVIKRHQPNGPQYFRKIYGVAPEVIDNLTPDKHDSVIKVLNIVGGLRLRGVDLENRHSSVFQHIVKLLDEGQCDVAQKDCMGFLQEQTEEQGDAK
ncbi:hypothetical protein Plec18170_003384 [Paecilomyces lecythidis]